MTGTARYQKLYSSGQCLRIVVNPSETNCYFASNINSSADFAIADINCEDGSVNSYYQATDYQIQNSKLYMGISNTGNSIFMTGSILNTGLNTFSHCRYNVNSTPRVE